MVSFGFEGLNWRHFFLQYQCSTNEITKNSQGMGGVNGYKQESVSLWLKKGFMHQKHKLEKFKARTITDSMHAVLNVYVLTQLYMNLINTFIPYQNIITDPRRLEQKSPINPSCPFQFFPAFPSNRPLCHSINQQLLSMTLLHK